MASLSYTIQRISDIIPVNQAIMPYPEQVVLTLIYDSRKLANPANGLFFALQGRRDGHEFIRSAYLGGVRNFIIANTDIDLREYHDANFLYVDDTLRALQQLAEYHRSQFSFPVIGITGSNGKTIVKEWLFQLLSPDRAVYRSPKSYNSQLGVALALWQLDSSYDLAIIEAGISQVGEMDHLREMIKPDIAILTNIGAAHDSGFASHAEKADEKLQLLQDAPVAIFSPKYLHGKTVSAQEVFTWGYRDGDDLQILSVEGSAHGHTSIEVRHKQKRQQAIIPYSDAAAVENVLVCWAVLLCLGIDSREIARRLQLLQPLGMRLELKMGVNNTSIIDDSYSNDISSLAIALDFIKQQQQHSQRTLILSDIPGAERGADRIYQQVADLLGESKINRLIAIGTELPKHASKFGFLDFQTYGSTASFLADWHRLVFHNESILVKGARTFQFEQISKLLTVKSHQTLLEINLNALETNLNSYRSILPKDIKLMVMVKAFSYGSGSFEIANLLQFNHVDYLTVAYADEGVELRKAGISLPIMVMSPDASAFDSVVVHRLEPELYSMSILESFIDYLGQKGIREYPVHIKIDTGMHRLGFQIADIPRLLEIISKTDVVHVSSVFSHLVASEAANEDEFTRMQIALFEEITAEIAKSLPYTFLRHLANTAAISRWPSAHFDMVRLGIGLYGAHEFSIGSNTIRQVGTLKTTITQIKKLKAGDSIGYGRGTILNREAQVATVKIGYADGYDRRFGNGVGTMHINGVMVPTLGNICMDMCMLDVTDVDVKEGDEVIVFGDIAALAKRIGTIPYELLTGISQRVKRVYFYE